MGMKAKSKRALKRKQERRNEKEARKALYKSYAESGNSKRKGIARAKRTKLVGGKSGGPEKVYTANLPLYTKRELGSMSGRVLTPRGVTQLSERVAASLPKVHVKNADQLEAEALVAA